MPETPEVRWALAALDPPKDERNTQDARVADRILRAAMDYTEGVRNAFASSDEYFAFVDGLPK